MIQIFGTQRYILNKKTLGIHQPASAFITGPGGWPRTVGHDLKFESTGGKMMLAPHSARRVETRRAE